MLVGVSPDQRENLKGSISKRFRLNTFWSLLLLYCSEKRSLNFPRERTWSPSCWKAFPPRWNLQHCRLLAQGIPERFRQIPDTFRQHFTHLSKSHTLCCAWPARVRSQVRVRPKRFRTVRTCVERSKGSKGNKEHLGGRTGDPQAILEMMMCIWSISIRINILYVYIL